jgi:hypothetical protein
VFERAISLTSMLGWAAAIVGGTVLTAPVRPVAAAISVSAGGDLQAALNQAQPGDIVELPAGAVFSGNFVLPAKGSSSAFITIRSAANASLPAEGARIQPGQAQLLAKIRSPNAQPALQTAPGAHHWRVQLLEFQANPGGAGDIITLGDGSGAQTALPQVPHDLVIDRCYIHGDAAAGQKRAIALNSASTTISGSYISDIKAIGQDSQAIAGWNGPGPFQLSNNYLEAAGENLLFGGADPSIPNLVPSDITITGNLMSRPITWRSQQWQVKNILELKNARRVSVVGNVMENNWQAAQTGFAVLFTVRNQGGHCPWCQVAQVSFEHNIVQHSAGGVSILGLDDNAPSLQTQSITIRNNLFADIDNTHWGGNGYFLLLTGTPRDIVIDHNTIIQDHAYGIAQVAGPPILGFVFTNNIARQNAYGIIGQDHAPGSDTISAFFPATLVTNNVIAGAESSRYPSGNLFPSLADFQGQFIGYDGGDYRLAPSSAWNHASTDGGPLGADLSQVPRTPQTGPLIPRPQTHPRPH